MERFRTLGLMPAKTLQAKDLKKKATPRIRHFDKREKSPFGMSLYVNKIPSTVIDLTQQSASFVGRPSSK